MDTSYAYGHWSLVAISALLVLFFLTRYLPVRTRFEKRSGGALVAFVIALFTEMYGFPLTIYILSTQLGLEIPLTHQYGHLLAYFLTYLGLNILVGWALVMAVSNLMILVGALWIARGWRQVYRSEGKLVTTGIYSRVRHPQYSGIILASAGFLVQWPTIPTLILFPFVVGMYISLARREERDVEAKFPDEYQIYRKRVPAFIPRIGVRRPVGRGMQHSST